MDTVVKTAWNSNTEQEYEIELPSPKLVENAILEIDFPSDGIDKWEIAEMLAEQFSLTEEQRNAKYKNDRRVFNVHLGLVFANLVKSGEMVKLRGSRWGRKLKESARDAGVTSAGSYKTESKSKNDSIIQNPEESIEQNYQEIRKKLAAELLTQIKANSPAFFEKLVIDLLVKMGYGGSREDAGKAVGKSGDGGIDGIINEDRLGLDMIYVQAKRWKGNVGEPPVRDFVGALDGEGVQKGVFITTSHFSPTAKNFAERSSKRIILIDGKQLAQLMIDHNVGVSIEKTYEIKRVDSDYFAEDSENS